MSSRFRCARIAVVLCALVFGLLLASRAALAQAPPPILITAAFEGGSLGTVEKVGDTSFRLHVQGQYDERGRNRQASWFYFRMDRVQDKELTLTLTDLVGEYNDKPGAVAFNADIVPVWSEDGRTWRPVERMEWNDQTKEATLHLRPNADRIWVAHQAPYTFSDLQWLLAEVDRSPHARVEIIGRSVQGRNLHLITITDVDTPDPGKRVVWLQARQHAWEAGTSYAMEGALRFLISDADAAKELRRRVIFKLQPMGDPDGCASGKVRFNANGWDVNRHWDEVDLRRKEFLERMPEIWYVKKAILAQMDSRSPIDLLVNLHNTETAEYVDCRVDAPEPRGRIQRLFDHLKEHTAFDPSREPTFNETGGTTSSLWTERKVPVMLMELRIGTSKKLGHRATVEDRLRFGAQLVQEMANAVLQ